MTLDIQTVDPLPMNMKSEIVFLTITHKLLAWTVENTIINEMECMSHTQTKQSSVHVNVSMISWIEYFCVFWESLVI